MIYDSPPAAPPVVDIDIVRDTNSTEYREQVDKAAKEFEGILLAQLFRVMRSTVPKTELMGNGFEREVYEDMMFTEIASVSARSESLGIADMLYRQFVEQSAPPDRADGTNPGGAVLDNKPLDL